MTDHLDDGAEAGEFLEKFLTELARGPLGAALLDLAAGRSRIVVKQHATKSGWVIETEKIEPPTVGDLDRF